MNDIVFSVDAARRALGALVHTDDATQLEDAHARALWSALIEPGDRIAGALIGTIGARRALALAIASAGGDDEAARAGVGGDELDRARARWRPRIAGAPAALESARRAGVRLVTPRDRVWPTRVADLGPFAPVCLWVRGEAGLLSAEGAGIALVGSRAASAYGEHVAAELAARSADAGMAVYSGAAYGIDAAAHSAALAVGGLTIAVMAGGVERPYPAGNRDLIERIARSGVVVSEVPCGTPPTKHRFLARNRLIATLSDATVVVEAGWRSGSLNTAHHAQAIGRPVGVVPGPVTSASSMGCHRLLREGDALCVTGFDDVREMLGSDPAVAAPTGGHTDDRTRVLDALSGRSARATAEIARRAGLAVEEAAALLGLLELDGVAERRVGGWVQRAPGAATLW